MRRVGEIQRQTYQEPPSSNYADVAQTEIDRFFGLSEIYDESSSGASFQKGTNYGNRTTYFYSCGHSRHGGHRS